MKIISLKTLPASLQEYFALVKTLKAKEARKERSKSAALLDLVNLLGSDTSLLIVTRKGLATCDVNPQAHPLFDRRDASQEVQEILEAERAVSTAHSRMAAALAAGKAAGKVTMQKKDSIRLEILNPEKAADLLAKYRQSIHRLRRGAAAPTPLA